MGWSGAGTTIFDPVARAVIDAGMSDGSKRAILSSLIEGLKAGDWDTEDESLEEFRNDPVIVALFAERGVTMMCGADPIAPEIDPCVRKLGHKGDHVNEKDNSWPPDVPA